MLRGHLQGTSLLADTANGLQVTDKVIASAQELMYDANHLSATVTLMLACMVQGSWDQQCMPASVILCVALNNVLFDARPCCTFPSYAQHPTC